MKRSSIAVTSPKPTDADWGLVEELADAWRAARDDTAHAYRAWCNSPIAQRRIAFAVYVAAADRETAGESAFARARGHAGGRLETPGTGIFSAGA